MTVTITLGNMIGDEADERLIYEVEGLVGSRDTYGLDTPISIITILDNLGIEFAISCLEYAEQDIRAAAQNVALDWIEANRDPWEYPTGGNSRVQELAFQAAVYMQANSEDVEPRLNYCGEPLDNGQSFTADALNGLADNLQEYAEGLNFVGTPQVYYHIVGGDPDVTTNALFQRLYGPTFDVDTTSYLPPITQSDDLISELLTNPLKTSFLENSAVISADTEAATFEGKGYLTGFGYSFWDGVTPLRNELNDGALGVAQACVSTAKMIANNANYLVGVYHSLVGAYASYREGRLREVNRVFARVNTIADTGVLPLSDDYWDTTIRNAGINAKVAVLQDYDWIKQYDVDDNDRISRSERGQMELGARSVAVDARKAKAEELSVELRTQMQTFLTLEPNDIESIFRLYFS